jgi:hypothetical protein
MRISTLKFYGKHLDISKTELNVSSNALYISLITFLFTKLSKQVKQSHYRPGQALRFPEVWGFQISRQSTREGGKVASPTHRPPLPQETFPVLISVRGRVDPRVIVRPEELCRWKNPMTPSRIKPATFRLVAQCLNQLRHQQRARQNSVPCININTVKCNFKLCEKKENNKQTWNYVEKSYH